MNNLAEKEISGLEEFLITDWNGHMPELNTSDWNGYRLIRIGIFYRKNLVVRSLSSVQINYEGSCDDNWDFFQARRMYCLNSKNNRYLIDVISKPIFEEELCMGGRAYEIKSTSNLLIEQLDIDSYEFFSKFFSSSKPKSLAFNLSFFQRLDL